MKFRVYFLLVMIVISTVFNTANSQSTSPFNSLENKSFSFVVIGAFVFHKNATRFTKFAKRKNLDAKFAMNPYRNLYYVYSFHSDSKAEAIEEVYRVRDQYNIKDAWVYSGQLNGLEGETLPELAYGEAAKVTQEVKPTYTYVAEKIEESVDVAPEQIENLAEDSEETTSFETEQIVETPEPTVVEQVASEDRPFGIIVPEDVDEPEIKEDFKVYINSVNSIQLTEVVGQVEVFDAVRNRKLRDTETHTLFGVNDPRNGSGEMKAVSRIFGYRPKEINFNPSNPETDTTGLVYTIGDSVVLDMPLDRLKKGDIAVMWNVLFYKDAAVMRPESKAELNSLLEMLQENPDMTIMIHGHTNGNSHGRIVYVGEDDINFFSLNGDHEQTRGSAKKLSEYRSLTIDRWLQSNGVEAARMQYKGWGGDKMLHGKHDPKAYENVRVEVEIIEDGASQ